MRIVKRLGAGAAVLGLATAGVVGIGAGAAHADGCSSYATKYGARVSLCLTGDGTSWGHGSWSVDTSGARTDERVYVTLQTNCGGYWHVVFSDNNNDYTQAKSGSQWVSCGYGAANYYFSSYATESGSVTGSGSVS
ncbi:hypothetical protein [Kitasatospora sp. NPDC086791]|uniref:hypothetical protein n=1 Tax=Kitasatospora sp. NPDC086791 TaxID=3155178 RepID=UPI0034268FB5